MAGKAMTTAPLKMVLVGGLPGSGKTYFGARIAGRVGVFVDKDVVSHGFTEALLKKFGQPPSDRESPEYLEKVRPLEYQAIRAVAIKNLEVGHSVVCSAPYIKEFHDNAWVYHSRIDAERHGAECFFVWMNADEEMLHTRIRNRNAHRDTWKLQHWETWYASAPKEPPLNISDLIVMDNTSGAHSDMQQQIVDFLLRIQSRGAYG